MLTEVKPEQFSAQLGRLQHEGDDGALSPYHAESPHYHCSRGSPLFFAYVCSH